MAIMTMVSACRMAVLRSLPSSGTVCLLSTANPESLRRCKLAPVRDIAARGEPPAGDEFMATVVAVAPIRDIAARGEPPADDEFTATVVADAEPGEGGQFVSERMWERAVSTSVRKICCRPSTAICQSLLKCKRTKN